MKLQFLDRSSSFACGFQIAILLAALRGDSNSSHTTDLYTDNLEQAKLCAEYCNFVMGMDGPVFTEERTGNNFQCVSVIFIPKEMLKPKLKLTRIK